MKKINKKVKIIGIIFTYILLLFWGIATTINLGQIKKDYKSLEKINITEKQKSKTCQMQKNSIQDSYEIVAKENSEKKTEIDSLNQTINDLNNKINDLNNQISSLKKK